jgi:UDP-glucose 4-epimerase
MRILVTGGMGFIGTATIQELKKSHSVTVYDIKAGDDILDTARLKQVFEEVKPEVVFHLAAKVSVVESLRIPSEYAATNILGTIAVAEQCNKWGSKLIYASSGGTIYGGRIEPFKEDDAAHPQSPYGISKYAGELYVQSLCSDHVILRYGNVYGPGQSTEGEAMVVAIFMDRIINDTKPVIRGNGLQTRDYIYISDVVDANVMALNWSGIINIGTGIATSVLDIYKYVTDSMGYDGTYDSADSLGEIEHISLSCKKANALGWVPKVPLEEGINKTARWAQINHQ